MKSSTTGSESSTTICERRRRIVGGGAEEIGEAAPIWMLVRARGFVPIDPAAAQVELLRGVWDWGSARRGESEGAAMMADAVSVGLGYGSGAAIPWDGSDARWEVREVWFDHFRPLDLMNEV
ncbi:Os02g0435500 [Oryza sativa Japonica Group]|jgi:hypothetical protein|uniref:Os02g0435500 protein n=1 Tax=Oryza sativa subsp. japonica TaxID=39947 RepID=A0A0P0VII2_ORYSJ|nr:Os02g0435500 [Oryza sativa Japonica Group]